VNSLDLYARFEPLIGFEREIEALHDLYLQELLNRGAKKVLDIGCGSGALLLKLQLAGIEAKGIDLSGEMVERALKKGARAERIDLSAESGFYDAAIAVFDVINYLPPNDLEGFFREVAKKISRFFIFDINSLYGFQEIAVGDLILRDQKIHATVSSIYKERQLISNFDLFEPDKDGKYRRSSSQIVQYYHSPQSVKGALADALFTIESVDEYRLYNQRRADKLIFTALYQSTPR
jgi:SAM-dependent methyltransferase